MTQQLTFDEKLDSRKELGDQLDQIDRSIVTEFLVEAAPVIEKLRKINAKMSNSMSFKGRSDQVLNQIDNGLLRDPLAILVVEQLKAAQTAQTETGSEPEEDTEAVDPEE